MIKQLSWDVFFKVLCGTAAVVFLVAIVLRLATATSPDVKLEYLLLSLGVAIVLPYLSELSAFGIKLEIKRRVDDLTGRVAALPDYVLGSEYHVDEDLFLAERAYRASLEKCSDFWPAALGLAGVFVDRCEYDRAVAEYNRVLTLDPENVYAFNNLAAVYIDADPPIRDPDKALEMANRALDLVPSLGSALYYKGEALNRKGSYAAASAHFKGMLSTNALPTQEHWTRYEMAIAGSNLGKGVSKEDLERMLRSAPDNSDARDLIARLADKEQQDRFRPTDVAVIRQFVKKNRAYLEEQASQALAQ